ncbi:MAG TPA: CPBP family intramembrane glutamic endopeptidase [Terriglobales bacterium]|nr:CPBP family intramembrane glutamic endopeptidase [Terriglobales bacterium]
MPGNHLTFGQKRALVLWILAGIAGLWYAQHNFYRAFPEASVDFKVPRAEALQRAQAFLAGLGENVTGYRSAIVFDVDEHAKVYLERQLGLKEADQVLSTQVNIWYWDVRFFKPQQQEEFRVRVSPSGAIVGYAHIVPEAQPGGSLDRAAAEKAAQDFAAARLGKDLSQWNFLPEEANSNQRPNRLDWTFTWEKKGFKAKDAPYRLEIGLIGTKPGDATEFLKVPEAWSRGYERLRSSNNTLETVFIVPYILLLGMAVWYGILLTKRGQTKWGGAIKIGVVAAGLLFLQGMNDWPLWGASYDTKDSYGSFLVLQIAQALVVAVVTALTISLVLPAAEPLYRSSQPERMQLRRVLSLRGLRTKEFFQSGVVGLSLAAAHIGFIVLFYIVATQHGAWAPQDLNYSDAVNTKFPWISGLAIGLLASTNEEFTFRLFAIPFFQKFTKSKWIAVIVPAFLWSFLHSNYPQEPAYIRGLEVGLIGIVAGLVMLRWGILATLIWHYTVDASLVGLFLLRTHSLYFKISGALVAGAVLIPLAYSVASRLSRGGFEQDEDLLNGAVPPPDLSLKTAASVEEQEVARRYQPLTAAMLGFLAVVLVLGGLIAWKLKPVRIGDYLKVSVDARGAKARADEILKSRGVNPDSYRHATLLVNRMDPETNEFLRERIGIKKLNEIYATQVPGALWSTRYFKDGQPEEYAVVLSPDGSAYSVHHKLAEDAPGASMTKDEAVALAENYLRDVKKLDLSQWSLVESTSDKKPHRIDHLLIWQLKAPLDGGGDKTEHAYERVELSVIGNEIANFRTYIKIPEDWTRRQEEWTLPRTLYVVVRILFYLGLGILALVLFFREIRSPAAQAVPWRRLASWGFWVLLGYVLVFAFGDRLPAALQQYPTAIPFKSMIGTLVIGFLLGGALWFGVIAFLFGLAWFYCSKAYGEDRLPSWMGMPGAYYRDALLIGLGGTAAFAGIGRLLELASKYWPTAHRAIPATAFPANLDAYQPFAAILGATVMHSLLAVGLLALIAGFLRAELKSGVLRIVILFFLAAAFVGSWGSPADFVKQFLANIILLGLVVFGVACVAQFNILGWFLVLAITSLLGGAVELLSQPNPFYHAQGYGAILLLVFMLAWPLVAWKASKAVAAP